MQCIYLLQKRWFFNSKLFKDCNFQFIWNKLAWFHDAHFSGDA